MPNRRIHLFRFLGFEVGADPGALIMAGVSAILLGSFVFPSAYEGLAAETYWAMGTTMALGLVLSILVHELGHGLMARHYSLPVRRITLTILGGAAELRDEPGDAETEFMVAAGGPIASTLVTGFWGLAWFGGSVSGWPVGIVGVLGHLAFLNLLFLFFNAVPALPMDGGRLLRAALWHYRSSLHEATRWTAKIGAFLSLGLIGLAILLTLSGVVSAGIWLLLIGIFLRRGSSVAMQQLILREVLSGKTVEGVMRKNPVAVPRSLPVARLVEDFLYRHPSKILPVIDDGQLLGTVGTAQVKALLREDWDRQSVGAIADPLRPEQVAPPERDALSAFRQMTSARLDQLLVTVDGELIGILELEDLFRLMSVRAELSR